MRALLWASVVVTACSEPPALTITGNRGTTVTRAPALEGVPFGSPVPAPANVSSTFGPRWKASAGRSDFHLGIDYYDAPGTPVFAIGAGTVEAVYADGSSTFPDGGNVVIVRHAIPPQPFHHITVDRIFAVYLHLKSFTVAAGDAVSPGQPIGAMGGTGDTAFNHLHFEIRVQTVCSLPYQVAHPESSCALGFDPHVHPFFFVGGDGALVFDVHDTGVANTYRYVATRSALDLDVIDTDRGTIGFSTREGLDATSLDALDDFDRGWVRLVPEPFTSDSERVAYELQFAEPIRYLEVRTIRGSGVHYGE